MQSETTHPLELDTRERLLTSALDVFLEKGYAAATTRAIAQHAGVNEVTLFRHFGNKQNLLVAIVDRFSPVDGLRSLLAGNLTGRYEQDLRQIASFLVTAMTQRPDIMPLVMYEAHQVPELREKLESIPREMLRLLVDYFEQQISKGHIRQDFSPFVLAQSFLFLYASFAGLVHAQRKQGFTLPLPLDTGSEQILELFLHGSSH